MALHTSENDYAVEVIGKPEVKACKYWDDKPFITVSDAKVIGVALSHPEKPATPVEPRSYDYHPAKSEPKSNFVD